MSLKKELEEFLEKGDLLQLAVAFIIGLAVANLIQSLVKNIINPLIGLPGSVNFASQSVGVHGTTFLWGQFITDVINFLILVVVIFFVIVRPYAKYQERREARKAKAPPTTKVCPECASTIPIQAKRCAFCTSYVTTT